MAQWFLIENEADYKKATERYEAIREAQKGSEEYKEMLLLALLINKYEESNWDDPEIDPIGLIKIRMEDMEISASELAKEYGDKGTISKVLNYKQSLSLTMIRMFSRMLRIPVEALIKEYKLKN